MKSESFVSVALVADRPLREWVGFLRCLEADLDSRFSDYEMLVITQGPAMVGVISPEDEAVLAEISGLRNIYLGSRVSQDVAWTAALENAIGDFVVLFDPISDPISAVSKSVALCKSGFDVVVGVADRPQSIAYRMVRSSADRLLRAIEYNLPRNATGFTCLSRRAVNSVTRTGRVDHQLSMQIQKTGYPQTALPYTTLPGRGHTRTLLSGVRDVARLVVFNSSRPLRWMSGLGFLGSGAAFTFAVYSVAVHLVKGTVVEGWTTTIFFISVLFLMQFVMMAFFGEYLARLLDLRGDHSSYSVVLERNSSIMLNHDRVNVLDTSRSEDVNRVQTGRDA